MPHYTDSVHSGLILSFAAAAAGVVKLCLLLTSVTLLRDAFIFTFCMIVPIHQLVSMGILLSPPKSAALKASIFLVMFLACGAAAYAIWIGFKYLPKISSSSGNDSLAPLILFAFVVFEIIILLSQFTVAIKMHLKHVDLKTRLNLPNSKDVSPIPVNIKTSIRQYAILILVYCILHIGELAVAEAIVRSDSFSNPLPLMYLSSFLPTIFWFGLFKEGFSMRGLQSLVGLFSLLNLISILVAIESPSLLKYTDTGIKYSYTAIVGIMFINCFVNLYYMDLMQKIPIVQRLQVLTTDWVTCCKRKA